MGEHVFKADRRQLRVRVGFVVHQMQVAGAEMLVAETIQRLEDRIDPVVFCLDGLGALGRRLKLAGIPVVWLGRRPGLDWSLAVRLGRELRAHRIDLLHAHQYTPFFYSALAKLAARRQIRLVMTEHGRHYPDRVSRARRLVNQLFLRHLADEINGCSRFSCQALVEVDGFPEDRVHVIENGVEVERYGRSSNPSTTRQRLDLDPERLYIVTVARFHPVKDHATLLRAFAEVSRQRPDVDLLLVGDGPLRPLLTDLVRELELGARVRFLGLREDVPEILGAADLFAMTSLSEAASLTVLEAMASELPVVLTAVGGNPEMIRPGEDGLLVPRGDAHGTAAAMLQLVDSAELRQAMGATARKRVEDRYRMEYTIAAYWDLYQRCLDGGAASRKVERQAAATPEPRKRR